MTSSEVGLRQIMAADPTFDVTTFLNQAGNSIFTVKKALHDRDALDAFDVVSPSVYDDLRTDVESLLDRGAVDDYDSFSIGQASVASAAHSAISDQIVVLYEGEYWTFSRVLGASSQSRPECPTCGAPIDIDTGRICRYCKTLLPPPNQQKGWTIVAITPATENMQ